VVEQFGQYVGRVLHADLGTSVFTHRAVLDDIAQVLPSSIELVLAAMVINVVVAVPLGVLAAYRRGRFTDIAARLVVLRLVTPGSSCISPRPAARVALHSTAVGPSPAA
jgi:ABC-type dipeptide/oligopeptide/nickel transport system permease component